MPVLKTYVLGMAVAHLLWLYFFTTGHLLRSKTLEQSRCFSITDLVITSVTGMAVAGFCLLLLGFTHLLNRPGIFVALVCEGALFLWLKGENWLSYSFWKKIGGDRAIVGSAIGKKFTGALLERGRCRRFLFICCS